MVKSSLVGNLLIAPPIIKTGFWAKSVALVTEHSKYSIGVILNKRSQVTLKEFGVQLGFKLNYPGFMYVGGPVNVRNLILLHSSEWTSGNMMCINDDIRLSSDEEIISSFSPREFQVIKYLADGYSNCDISEFLHISNKTVSTYKNRIYRKLGVNNIAELIAFCRSNKIIDI